MNIIIWGFLSFSQHVAVLSIIKSLFSVAVLHTLLSFVYVHNKTPSRRIIDGKKEKMVTSRWAFSIAETCFQLLFLCCCCCFHFSLHMYLPTSFVLISGSSGKWQDLFLSARILREIMCTMESANRNFNFCGIHFDMMTVPLCLCSTQMICSKLRAVSFVNKVLVYL